MLVLYLVALGLAALIPVSLVAIRHEVRLRRIRMIEALQRTLEDGARTEHAGSAASSAAAGETRAGGGRTSISGIVSFEFVKAKYAVDLDPPDMTDGAFANRLRNLDFDKEGRLDNYLTNLGWRDLRSNWAILRASIGYVIVCSIGLLGLALLFRGPGAVEICLNALGCGAADNNKLVIETNTARFQVFAAAFLGSLLFTIRVFVKAVAVFDLNPVTMARATLHILLNTAAAILIHGMVTFVGDGVGANELLPNASTFWPAMAFVFGFVPDAGLLYLLNKAGRGIGLIKTADETFAGQIRSTPLDVIDGVDFFIRFRLDESNVSEVQSLATANPLMLFIETPYGLYQTVDWVAQAQLCAVVGLERFLMLRQVNIRTIFDLERAVLGEHTTPAIQALIGGILLAETRESRDIAQNGGRRFATIGLLETPRAEFAEFFAAAASAAGLGRDGEGRLPSVEHLVRVMIDDLHVHRLRQIWLVIAELVGTKAARMLDTREPKS